MSESESGKVNGLPDESSIEPPSDYTFPADKSTTSEFITPTEVNRVYQAVVEYTGGDGWIRAKRVDIDDLNNSQIGYALEELAGDPDCPLAFERWNDKGGSRSALYRVTERERELVADGGTEIAPRLQDCPDCGTTVDRYVNRQRCWRCHGEVFDERRLVTDGGERVSRLRDDMMDYLDNWSPAENASMTTNGILVDVSSYQAAGTVQAIYDRHGWVIDQIHWESQMFHIVPAAEFDGGDS